MIKAILSLKSHSVYAQFLILPPLSFIWLYAFTFLICKSKRRSGILAGVSGVSFLCFCMLLLTQDELLLFLIGTCEFFRLLIILSLIYEFKEFGLRNNYSIGGWFLCSMGLALLHFPLGIWALQGIGNKLIEDECDQN